MGLLIAQHRQLSRVSGVYPLEETQRHSPHRPAEGDPATGCGSFPKTFLFTWPKLPPIAHHIPKLSPAHFLACQDPGYSLSGVRDWEQKTGAEHLTNSDDGKPGG